MKPVEAYKRWRHTRGYGVHSPFAYDMVCTVVRPGADYALYGYVDIDNALTTDSLRDSRRHARMLLRLAAFLNPGTAFLPNDAYARPYRAALRAANSKMRVTSALAEIDDCRLVCSSGTYVPLEKLCELVARPDAIISLRDVPQGWCNALFDALPEGLMLYSKDAVILVNRPAMQKVAYSIHL